MPPPRTQARQALVEQAVQRCRDRERLVSGQGRPRRAPQNTRRTPRQVVASQPPPSNGYARGYYYYAPVNQNSWTPLSAFSAFTSMTFDIQLTTGSTTLAYDQPWTWVGANTTYSLTAPSFTSYTPEQIEANRLHRERVRAEGARMEAERRAANVVAYELLDTLLTEEQRRQFQQERTITVKAPSGNCYMLVAGRHAGNVHMWHPDRQTWSGRLCVHISEGYPDGDNLAAQLLMIQTEEDRFLGTANIQDGVVPPAMQQLRNAFHTGVRLDPERRALAEQLAPSIAEVYEELQEARAAREALAA